jgi:hypothetical protein
LVLHSQIVGGIKTLTQDNLLKYEAENDSFRTALIQAREEYLKTHGDILGALVKASEQIVSGVNYRFVFKSKNG